MNAYEEKKAARIERYQDRAACAKERSAVLYKKGMDELKAIPFGQPILVGHHSEKADRAYRARATGKLDRAFEESKKSDYWDGKAMAAECNDSISSDDPDASSKLMAKIDEAISNQEKMKTANKIFKSKKIDSNQKVLELVKAGFSEKTAKEFIQGSDCVPRYALTNNNANISRMKKRLEIIDCMSKDVTKETIINDIKVIDNVELNRVQIFFDGKPSEEVRSYLKHNGFRWAPSVGAWQRGRGRYALDMAKKACTI